MNFIFRILITSLVAYVLSFLLEPHIHIKSYGVALLFVIVLGILNVLIKPLFILLTLPITILTLGLFLIVINVLMVLLASRLTDGISIENFWWALAFSVMLSFFSSAIRKK